MAKKPKAPQYDIDYVRSAARGQWPTILYKLGGIDPELLDGQHHPCPRCGGTDRFRLIDADAGALLCNQCFSSNNGDGFSALAWLTGEKFGFILGKVADFLGIEPSKNGSSSSPGSSGSSKNSDPAEHLTFQPWNELLVSLWCTFKPPITPAAVQVIGGRLARYRKQYTVIALPVWGEQLELAKPVGWCLYNVTGGTLPKWTKKPDGTLEVEQVKVKLAFGSKPGWIGPVSKLAAAAAVWKLEGPTDLMAFCSLPDLPQDVIGLTNFAGAGEQPQQWMLKSLAGKLVNLLHDADTPGQEGLIGKERGGRYKPGWLELVAPHVSAVFHAKLPHEVVENHGPDLRDLAKETEGFSYSHLAALERTRFAKTEAKPLSNEAPDDPHRLARVNLDHYASQGEGATLRYWRGEWYTWKPSRGCYKTIDKIELRAKIGATIKKEFDRINAEEIEEWERKGDDTPKPVTRKVTEHLITNVLSATASSACVKFGVELMTWLKDGDVGPGDDGERVSERQNYIAMKNGILDLDRLLEDRPTDGIKDVLLPHSRRWFSTVRLPYAFDPDAKCPKWEAFLERNLELDPERIKLVQEWAGYLLLPDNSHQAFLAMEGEGANGKSVYCAAIAAMLGNSNCSYVSVDNLSDKFVRTQTLGRLVNICPDVSEIDKANEGDLKSFIAGDVMFFDRKFLSGLNCVPTARLMMSFNNRPRWSDRSSGIWRRMLLVPWQVEISREERVRSMDQRWWWEASGELPGIFLWAVLGLNRLRQQGRFTESSIGAQALSDYQQETNPARAFLLNHFEISTNTHVKCDAAYEHYVRWIEANGYKPLGEALFGKEVRRVFKGIERKRGGGRADRYWYYSGMAFSVDEICGKKIESGMMF